MNDAKYKTLFETLKMEILGGKYNSQRAFPSIRALIRRHGVSKTTVQRVLDELVHQGLIVRKQGRGTFVNSVGSNRKIGLIMPGVAYSTFFGPIVSEINRLARANQYELRLVESYSQDAARRLDEARDLAASFLRLRVAGVLFQPLEGISGADELNLRILQAFSRARIPVVVLDGDIIAENGDRLGDSVGIDDMEAGVRLANHLIAHGARRIAFLLHRFSASCDPADENRLHGVMMGVQQRGLFFDLKKSVLRAAPDDAVSLKRFLRRMQPDAFVCSNDSAAAIFWQTLSAVGKAVPRDVRLASFGDLPIAALLTPALTTIRQDPVMIAHEAFNRLLARISNPTLPPVRIAVAAPLVVRASSAPQKACVCGGRKCRSFQNKPKQRRINDE